MRFQLVETEDGSLSCLDSETGELCHNRAGAYTEALKHYVEPSGLLQKARSGQPVKLLDACFGLGYNSLVFLNELMKDPPDNFAVTVIGIETSEEILSHLPRIFDTGMFDSLKSNTAPTEHNIYYRILLCLTHTKGEGPSTKHVIREGPFHFEIRLGDLRDEIQTLDSGFDAIFHDPFSPASMPELWTVDIFRHYVRLLHPDGLLLTYSTAAAVRGGLVEAGFKVHKTPALGGKPGGTVAGFGILPGEPPDEWEIAYMQSKAGVPYRDNSLKSLSNEVLQVRKEEQAQSERLSGTDIRKSKIKF